MGAVTMRASKRAAIDADRDKWMRQAVAATIAAAKDLVAQDGPIRPGTPIGQLTESEWGWITSSAIWAWIATRSEQATTEGSNEERAARAFDARPDPWLAGAVASILPKLFDACPGLDWARPVGEWSKDDMVALLCAAFALIERAIAARDASEEKIAGKINADITARQMNAAAGNPRMTPAELSDDLPPF